MSSGPFFRWPGVIASLAFLAWHLFTGAQQTRGQEAQDKIATLEKTITAEQRKMLDEMVELQLAAMSKEGRTQLPDREFMRKQQLRLLASLPPEDLEGYWQGFPTMLLRMRRRIDPFWITPEEKAAAAALPPSARQAMKKLLSDDIEDFLASRRAVLAHGSASKALVAD